MILTRIHILTEGRIIIVCNCLHFKDHDKNNEIRHHVGTHPQILEETARNVNFMKVNLPFCEAVPSKDKDEKTLTLLRFGTGHI